MVKEIIFDFDGTLADSFETIVSVFKKNKELLGLKDFGQKEIDIYRQKGIRELLRLSKVSILKLPKIIKDHRGEMSKLIDQIKPFDGIKETLLKLKNEGYILGILSTNSEDNINKFLKKNKIEVFSYISGKGSLFGKDKAIKSILKKRGLKKEEVYYVGDEIRDIEACKKLGIKILAVTWGFNDEKVLKEANPDFLIKKPEDILKKI